MTTPTEEYQELFLDVKDIEVDPRVQRGGLNRAKITRMVRDFNPGALGLIHTSFRTTRAHIILDGWHRLEAVRIVTSNTGQMWAREFTGLTLAEESQMFLDLNRTSSPLLIDKFNVLLNGDSTEAKMAQDLQSIANSFGWKVARTSGPGNVNCIGVLQKLYLTSVEKERDPNLVLLTFLAITDAWGTNDNAAVNGAIMEGIGAMYDEYGSNLDQARLVQVLRETEGGPTGLLARATNLGKTRNSKRSMAVADLIVEAYNRGLRRNGLTAWRRR